MSWYSFLGENDSKREKGQYIKGCAVQEKKGGVRHGDVRKLRS